MTTANNFTIDTSLPINVIYKNTEEQSPKDQTSELSKNIYELNKTINKLAEIIIESNKTNYELNKTIDKLIKTNHELSKTNCELIKTNSELNNKIHGLYQVKTANIPPPPPPPLPNNSCLKNSEKKSTESSISKQKQTISTPSKSVQTMEEMNALLDNNNPTTDPKKILDSIRGRRKTNSLHQVPSIHVTTNTSLTIESKKSSVVTDSISQVENLNQQLDETENDRKKQFSERKNMFEPLSNETLIKNA